MKEVPPGLKLFPRWDIGTICSSFTHYATTPAPISHTYKRVLPIERVLGSISKWGKFTVLNKVYDEIVKHGVMHNICLEDVFQ